MNHQRKGAISNAHVGREFEELILDYFQKDGLDIYLHITIPIGIEGKRKKPKQFDMGDHDSKIIIECKAMTWTVSNGIPSSKLTKWNYEMFNFFLAPKKYRKMFVVQKSFNENKNQTLAEYYIDKNFHLIPDDVEFYEFDIENKVIKRLL